MALAADTIWEVQSTANDTNGGGFSYANKGATGVDYSQQTAYQVSWALTAAAFTFLVCSGN